MAEAKGKSRIACELALAIDLLTSGPKAPGFDPSIDARPLATPEFPLDPSFANLLLERPGLLVANANRANPVPTEQSKSPTTTRRPKKPALKEEWFFMAEFEVTNRNPATV